MVGGIGGVLSLFAPVKVMDEIEFSHSGFGVCGVGGACYSPPQHNRPLDPYEYHTPVVVGAAAAACHYPQKN